MSNLTPSNPHVSKGISEIIAKIEQENLIFANKKALDYLSSPSKILGREEQMEKLVRFLLGYRYNHVVPFISVYGRSGSGKTTVVQHVCHEFKDAECAFVNLRRARTIFSATNLILEKLGLEIMKGSKGNKIPFDKILDAINGKLDSNGKKLFVLVLDEFDVIFNDPRGRPSDFIYQLTELEKDLANRGLYFCVIAISNDILSKHDIDDRVKSRLGASEIFFDPYHLGNVLIILEERAKEAFTCKIDDAVLKHCAKLASEDHGDARRALDLLRVAAETASAAHQTINTSHVDRASRELHHNRIEVILTSASYNFKRVLASLARITFLSKQDWHFTSVIVQQYHKVWIDGAKPLTYRRVSEILHEMEGMGLVVSQIGSRGRHGYGRQYKLELSPHVVGRKLNVNWWEGVLNSVKIHEQLMQYMKKHDDDDISEKQKDKLKLSKAVDEKEKQWNSFIWQDDVSTDENGSSYGSSEF
jgi:archaeal cell division control protein 6